MKQLSFNEIASKHANVVEACVECYGHDAIVVVCLDVRGRWHALCDSTGSASLDTPLQANLAIDIISNLAKSVPNVWPAGAVFAAVVEARSSRLHNHRVIDAKGR